MRVCHFVTNPYTFDTRVKNQCESLVELGCDVSVVATHRPGLPTVQRMKGVRVHRIEPRLRSLAVPFIVFGKATQVREHESPLWSVAAHVVRGITATGTAISRTVTRAIKLARNMWFRREKPVPTDEEMIESALHTEIRFPTKAHLKFWGLFCVGVLLLPLLPVLAVLALFAHIALKVTRWFLRACRRLLRRTAPSRNSARRVRREMYRFIRMCEMIRHGYDMDANAYQANDYDTLAAAWVCAKLRGVNYVYDIHELYDESFPTRKGFYARYWIRLWEGFFGRRALRTITVGENIRRVMVARYGFASPVVIHNAQVYRPAPPADPYIREQIDDRDCRRTVFIYAGRITRGRGLLESVRAFRRLPESLRERAALVIMGNADAAFLRELTHEIDALDLHDCVHLLEPVPSDMLPAVLQGADVGLMLTNPACLSYYYGLGNKMFHYVNAGIPVLASRHPEKERFVMEHGVGRCVDHIEPKSIALAMEGMMSSAWDLSVMKAKCRAVAPEVAWQREQEKYVNIYTDVYEDMLFNIRGAA